MPDTKPITFPAGWRPAKKEPGETLARKNKQGYIITQGAGGAWRVYTPTDVSGGGDTYHAKTLSGALASVEHFTAAFAALEQA
jgi:hypothetical protein